MLVYQRVYHSVYDGFLKWGYPKMVERVEWEPLMALNGEGSPIKKMFGGLEPFFSIYWEQ